MIEQERWESHRREHGMMQTAIDKSDSAMDARLASMNEFRAQLHDQSSTFVTRDVFEIRMRAIERTVWSVMAIVTATVVLIPVVIAILWRAQ